MLINLNGLESMIDWCTPRLCLLASASSSSSLSLSLFLSTPVGDCYRCFGVTASRIRPELLGTCSPRDATSITTCFPDESSTSAVVDGDDIHNRQKETDRTNEEAQGRLGVDNRSDNTCASVCLLR